MEKAGQVFTYNNETPWPKATPPLDKLIEQDKKSSRESQLTIEAMQVLHQDAVDARGGVDDETKAQQQAELDNMVADMVRAKTASPLARYAYTPGENTVFGLITSQFLHGGWLHLIGNMLFLWLSGCNVEDRWGRVLFPIFYLSAGVVAALVHKAGNPHSMAPLIGASGAIAGVMGAFLIKFAKTRIKFLLFIGFRPRTFTAPAYLMLPLWLLEQLFYGLMTAGGDSGVAFWAHVGGFIYGMAFALVLPMTGMEQKVDQRIEGQVSLQQAPEILEASELIEQGKAAEAIEVLEKFAASAPTNVEAQLELLRAAKATQDTDRERRAYLRLIGLYMRENAPDTALQLYQEMQQLGIDSDVAPAMRLRLARYLEKLELPDQAINEYVNIYSNGKADQTAFQGLLAHANLMLKLKRKEEAIKLFTVAQNSPVPHLDWDTMIAHGLRQAEVLPNTKAGSAT